MVIPVFNFALKALEELQRNAKKLQKATEAFEVQQQNMNHVEEDLMVEVAEKNNNNILLLSNSAILDNTQQ